MNKNFILFGLTQFTSILNDNLIKNAIVAIVIFLNGKNGSFPEIAGGLFVLPFLLLSSISGELADKYNKANILKYLKISELFIVILSLISILIHNTLLMYAVIFLLGIQSTIISPVRMSLVPKLVKRNHLTTANGIIDGSGFIAVLIGTLVGSYICKYPCYLLLLSVISLSIVFIGSIISILGHSPDVYQKEMKLTRNLYKSTLEYCKEIKRFHISYECYHISYFWLTCSALVIMFPKVVRDVLHFNECMFTLFLFIFTIGMGIGSVLSNVIPIKSSKILITLANLMILGLGITVFEHYMYGIYTMLFLVSFCSSIYSIRLYTDVQTKIEEHHTGRVFSAINVFNSLFIIIGSLFLIGANHMFLPYWCDIFIIGIIGMIPIYKEDKTVI